MSTIKSLQVFLIVVGFFVLVGSANGKTQSFEEVTANAKAFFTDGPTDRLIVQEDGFISLYRLSDRHFLGYLHLEAHPGRVVVDSARDKIYVSLPEESSVAVFGLRIPIVQHWIYVGHSTYHGKPIDVSTFYIDATTGALHFKDAATQASFTTDEITYPQAKTMAEAPSPAGLTPSAQINVNTIDSGGQTLPRVKFDGSGNFVFTYSDEGGSDGSGEGVLARIFNANLTPKGPDFHVNKLNSGDQGNTHIAVQSNGDFIISWRDSAGHDGDSFGSYIRPFNSDGTPKLTTDVLASVSTAGKEMEPTVVCSNTGTYMVFWSGPDADGRGTYARRFNSSASPMTGETHASTTTNGTTWGNEAASNASGQSVVVWRDDNGDRIRGRVYDSSGNPISGNQFQAGPFNGSNSNFEPSTAVFGDGSFIVVWRETGAGGIIAQRFNADGSTHGSMFKVSSNPVGGQFSPSVAGSPDGHFVVTWRDTNGSTFNIKARWFDENASPQGNDFFVEDPADDHGDDFEATAAMDSVGNFIITWRNQAGPTSIAAVYYSTGGIPSQLTVTGVDAPGFGNRGATLTVGVNGTGFTNDAVASFPDDPNITVNSTTFVDDSNLNVNITIGALAFLGLHDIRVDQSSGNATGNDLFAVEVGGSYPAPTVLSAVPNIANQGDSISVTIAGTDFANVPGQLSADFGSDIGVSNLTFVNGSTLTATLDVSSSAATGLRNFSVSNPGPATGTCTNCFTVVFNPVLYSDNFGDGDASDWSSPKGTWTVVSGALQGQASSKATITSPFAGCGTCSVSADIKRGPNNGAIISFFGWYVDKKNNVELQLDKDKGQWLLKQKFNGDTAFKQTFKTTLNTGQFYHVVLIFDGANFTVFVDGTQILGPIPKGAGSNPFGTIAFKIDGAIGTIDNVEALPFP